MKTTLETSVEQQKLHSKRVKNSFKPVSTTFYEFFNFFKIKYVFHQLSVVDRGVNNLYLKIFADKVQGLNLHSKRVKKIKTTLETSEED